MDRSQNSDDELIRAAGDGDRSAVAALFDRYAATVTRYAWTLMPRRMDVEEVVQDSFVTLWQKASSLELPDESILRWVRDEIDALSPLDRQVCELCLLDGRSYSEAATMLGLGVGAVTQRLSRCRIRIRKAVTRDEL